MNITFIASKLNMNNAGSNISLDTIATGLERRGHTVTVLTMNLTVDNKVRDNAPYTVYNFRNENDSANTLSNMMIFIREIAPTTDVFHVFAPLFAPLLGYYRYLGGETPVVGRLNSYTMFCTNSSKMDGNCHKDCTLSDKIAHDDDIIRNKIKKIPMYSYTDVSFPRIANEVDRYFAQSPSIRQYYSEAGIDEQKMVVISNFYNTDFYEGDQDQPENGIWDKFNLLYVGRIENEKGVDILVEAATHLTENHHIHIVGDGDQLPQLRKLARQQETDEIITFHGWVDREDLPAYYSNSQIFVHPGRWPEPSGRAILEALQYNCPIVASNIGGPQWIKGEAGVVFEQNNSQDLSEKIMELSSNKTKYKKARENCEKRLEYFSSDNVLTRIENEYKNLL